MKKFYLMALRKGITKNQRTGISEGIEEQLKKAAKKGERQSISVTKGQI